MAYKRISPMPVIEGGTGQTTLTNHGVLVGAGTGAITQLSVGSTGTVLIGTSGSDPSFSATPTVTSITISNAPSVGTDGTNKTYVDAIASGIEFKSAVYAASTANLNATYLNGASGVGATLVNAGALAAFTIDGTTPPITSRILVKDQTSTFQNGIYTLTTVGSGAVAWVLTRALDYDQAAEIQPGDLVPVINGTVNATTQWLETATVTTIGTDPILFVQFSFGPNKFASSFPTDSGTATVSNGTLTVAGGTGINTSGSGSTVTINLTNPVTVPLGGTGVATMTTAYAPVCAGTTATGALQVASTGLATSGFILTSNGNAALPSFKTPAASSISITGDTGGALTGNAFIFAGGTTGLSFGGSGSTETLTFAGITANGGTVSLATDATTSTINVGTGAGVKTSTFGSTNSTSATTLQSGSGALNVTSTNGALTINSGTGSLGISTDASANTVNIATGGAVKTTTLGSTNSTSATTVQSGSGALNITSTNGALTINSGTGTLGISTDAAANTVNIATGAAVKATTLGSTNSTSATTVQSGSGNISITSNGGNIVSTSNNGNISLDSGTGIIGISTGAAATTVDIATGSAVKTLVLGSVNSTSSTTLQSGSGAINITSTNGVISVDSGTGTIGISTGSAATTVNIANGSAVKTLTLGSINSTSATTLQAGSGGIALTGVVTSANAITITSGNMTLSAGNLALTATTSSSTGSITQGGVRFVHSFGAASDNNIFVGASAGNYTLTSGSATLNTGVGVSALAGLTTSTQNVGVGYIALTGVSSGVGLNVAVGYAAGYQLTTGTNNTFIGGNAGNAQTTSDSSNILIGSGVFGTASNSNRLIIGAGTGTSATQINVATICGITGKTSTSGIAVLVNSSNVLGTSTSSIRFKDNVEDMGTQSDNLHNLRPVTFTYKKDDSHVSEADTLLKQYGLIAEEVDLIMPDLVSYNENGQIESVRYLSLIPMLLNEVQKLRKELNELKGI